MFGVVGLVAAVFGLVLDVELEMVPVVAEGFGALNSIEAGLELGAQLFVVGCISELQVAGVVQVSGKLYRQSLAQHIDRDIHLLLHDPIIFVLLRIPLNPLPRQVSHRQIHQAVAETLHVVPSALLQPHMRVKTGVAGGADETLALLVGDVSFGCAFAIPFRQAIVDNIDMVCSSASADGVVVGLDVPMEKSSLVEDLDAGDLRSLLSGIPATKSLPSARPTRQPWE